jgi:hypothetical protein
MRLSLVRHSFVRFERGGAVDVYRRPVDGAVLAAGEAEAAGAGAGDAPCGRIGIASGFSA